MDINELIEKTQGIEIIDIIDDSVHNTRENLVRLQRLQMLHGEDSTGKKIGVYKSASGKKKSQSYGTYASMKYIMNKLAGFGFVDLRLTGSFYNEIFADDRESYVVLDSADPKTGKLIEKYGEEIFGLNIFYAMEYSNEYLGPEISNQFIKKIHGQ